MAWTIALVLPIAAMALALVLHALNVVPFAPLVTTLQKIAKLLVIQTSIDFL